MTKMLKTLTSECLVFSVFANFVVSVKSSKQHTSSVNSHKNGQECSFEKTALYV